MKRLITYLAILSFLFCDSTNTHADTFGSGQNSFEIKFVPIGNPGNPADTTGDPNPAGSVPYSYRIGKYEISEQMIDKANALGRLGITKDSRGPDKPATSINWLEAAKFANWLNTSTGHTPAYKFGLDGAIQLWSTNDAGYNPNNFLRNSLAKYFLPSTDEWYKAAYYDPIREAYYNYALGSNNTPVPVASGVAPGTAVYKMSRETGPADIDASGGLSPYSTMGQCGNVWEWEETEYDLVNDSVGMFRGVRGGDWVNYEGHFSASRRFWLRPVEGSDTFGFRVASVPEPSMITLSLFTSMFLFVRRVPVSF